MTPGAIAAIVYGVFAVVGGIVGYAKAKSTPSLISGVISGALLIIAGIVSSMGMSWGIPLAIAITGILVIVFIYRLVKTRKFIPAGLMTIAGIAALIVMFKG
ncbi:MAG: TMEM14 family protein [Leptolyngbyaceae bacterium]|nr:TMEM14 family protein [Leptolyngbyaceae bacterium]